MPGLIGTRLWNRNQISSRRRSQSVRLLTLSSHVTKSNHVSSLSSDIGVFNIIIIIMFLIKITMNIVSSKKNTQKMTTTYSIFFITRYKKPGLNLVEWLTLEKFFCIKTVGRLNSSGRPVQTHRNSFAVLIVTKHCVTIGLKK